MAAAMAGHGPAIRRGSVTRRMAGTSPAATDGGGSTSHGADRQRPHRPRGRYRPLSEINVTPLVDVMLVLLIIFMVTAPLMTSGVSVDLPKTDAKPLNTDSQPLTVSIDAAGKIFLQDQEVQLPELVDQAAGDRPEQPGPPHLRARRQGPGLRADHGGDGHHHPGRLHQGGAAGRTAGDAAGAQPAAPAPAPAPAARRPDEGGACCNASCTGRTAWTAGPTASVRACGAARSFPRAIHAASSWSCC